MKQTTPGLPKSMALAASGMFSSGKEESLEPLTSREQFLLRKGKGLLNSSNWTFGPTGKLVADLSPTPDLIVPKTKVESQVPSNVDKPQLIRANALTSLQWQESLGSKDLQPWPSQIPQQSSAMDVDFNCMHLSSQWHSLELRERLSCCLDHLDAVRHELSSILKDPKLLLLMPPVESGLMATWVSPPCASTTLMDHGPSGHYLRSSISSIDILERYLSRADSLIGRLCESMSPPTSILQTGMSGLDESSSSQHFSDDSQVWYGGNLSMSLPLPYDLDQMVGLDSGEDENWFNASWTPPTEG